MIRLLIVGAAGLLLYWGLRRLLATPASELSRSLKRFALYMGGAVLIGLGVWLGLTGRLHLAWIGLMGLLPWLRRGYFLYNILQRFGFGRGQFRAEEGLFGTRSGARSEGMGRDEAAALLGVASTASKTEIERAYRDKIRHAHPDAGGDAEQASKLNRARDRLLQG